MNQQNLFEVERFWRQTLKGFMAPTPLVVDQISRNFGQNGDWEEQEIQLSETITSTLKYLTQQHQLPLNIVIRGVWALLLSRYSGEEDILFGIAKLSYQPTVERIKGAGEPAINALPFRIRVAPEEYVLSWLKSLLIQFTTWQEYQYTPLMKIREWSDVPVETPLFESVVAFEDNPLDTALLEQLNYPLIVNGYLDSSLLLKIVYDKHRFDDATIARMLGHIKTLIEGLVANPERQIFNLPLLTDAERRQLLVGWNDTQTNYPKDLCIHQLFEAQVERTPDNLAIIFEDKQLTYRELNRRANQLAHYLQGLGVGPEIPIGLCIERSVEMIIGILGILKAGGIYVPLDPTYPQERQTFILEDTQALLLLTQQRLVERLPSHKLPVICLDTDWQTITKENEENLVNQIRADNLAYVMYTSGSTGKPKGVSATHRGVVRLVKNTNYINLSAKEIFLQFAPITFDASTLEIWGSLLNGAQLVIFPNYKPSLQELGQVLERYQITTLWLTAGLFHQMVDNNLDSLKSVRQLLAGGDVLFATHVKKALHHLTGCRLINGYGPTENTTFTCCYSMAYPAQVGVSVSIGRPIANTQVYILDQYMQPVPVGVPGELYTGGDGLARGYLNRPELTDEKFISNPFNDNPEARLYKTGDMVRYLPDGNIEFIGRVDHQVKIRGFRIEPGEIEAVLGEHPDVWKVVVLAREDTPGDKRLVAYLVPEVGHTPTVTNLRRFLQDKLPEYMIPSDFVLLDTLPLTPIGKVDRQALPAPNQTRPDLEEAFVAPRTATQDILAGLGAEILGLEQIGIHDNLFDLGAHSLLITQLISRVREVLQVELPLNTIFENPVVADLAKVIENGHGGELGFPAIQPISRDGELPLSFSQERVWFIEQLNPGNKAYIFQSILRFKGLLNKEALEQSLGEIIRRHEIFRTTFHTINGQPQQVIHQAQPIKLPVVNLQTLPESEGEAEAQRLLNQELQKPFDLSRLPLIRWTLLRLNEYEHILIHVEHHIVHDGWSFNIFLKELAEFYKTFATGKPARLPEQTIQFVDFAYWQRQWMERDIAQTQLNYWQKKLVGDLTVLQMPIDHPRPPVQTFRGATPRVELPLELYEALRIISRQEGVTLFMTMLAAFLALLYRYSGQDDICVGTSIANRRWRETEGLIGMILNNLVLRVDMSGNPAFQELLDRVREVTLEAYAHQDVPFDRVVEALQPKRDLSRNPLFQVMFSFHDSPLSDLDFPELTLDLQEGISNGSAKFDLNIIMIPRREQHVGQNSETKSDGLTILWEYNTELFNDGTISRMIEHYLTLLTGIVANRKYSLSDLPILTEAEYYQLLVSWNDTRKVYPNDKCIHQLFEEQVKRTPDAIALIFEGQQLTYSQLNEQANQLAHYLRNQGVESEVLVGICLERSFELVIGLLGILKAGGAYIPLDPTYPQERLAFMLEDSRTPLLVTQQQVVKNLPKTNAQIIYLDIDWEAIAEKSTIDPENKVVPDNLAYVMYTSGSTGNPKGVMIPHRGLVNYLSWCTNAYSVAEGQGAPVHSSIGFDLTITSLFSPLLVGQRVVLLPEEGYGVEQLSKILCTSDKFSLVKITPSHLEMINQSLSANNNIGGTKALIIGGETLLGETLSYWRTHSPDTKLINEYGPTETVVGCCVYEVPVGTSISGVIPIGRPIANTQIYILDTNLQPVPIGVTGELYIGGDGVARGYLNRPELTAERFIRNPFSQGSSERLYKTGDLARYLPDGNIEFLGRVDHQVKIRGFRIELEEIEVVLGQYPTVQETVVVAREDLPGDKNLVAYVVSEEENLTATELRNYLKQKLPEYMIPSVFVMLKTLPLTVNGKIDRGALPEPDRRRSDLEHTFVAPRTEIEKLIAKTYAEVLKLERIGIYDNFFELGGHSLLAMQVVSRLRDIFQIDLPLRSIFESPTVAGLTVGLVQKETEQVDDEMLAQMLAELEQISEN